MEDFNFYKLIPRFLLKWILLGILIISIAYGYVKGDSKKGYEFFSNKIHFVTKPLMDKVKRAMNRPLNIPVDNKIITNN